MKLSKSIGEQLSTRFSAFDAPGAAFDRRRFATYAWCVLGYSLLIVLWGAFVRASGSGAGCGSHWPLCNGQVIPQAPAITTLIEFVHRLSSGLALLLIAGLFVWAFRSYGKGHPVRLGATLSSVFIITEALVGAGLVLFSLVAHNASVARALFIAVHLLNPFFLLASLTLTAWWASGGKALRLRGQGALLWALLVGWLGTLVLGMTGAITALGDTLFPSQSLAEGMAQDFAATAHFLIRLRIFHPLIAVVVGVYLLLLARLASTTRPSNATSRFAWGIVALFALQFAAGIVIVALLAPIWMQLLHLLLADLLWIMLVLLSAAALGAPSVQVEVAPLLARSAQALGGEQDS